MKHLPDPLLVECVDCGALVGAPCRSLSQTTRPIAVRRTVAPHFIRRKTAAWERAVSPKDGEQ